MSRGKNHSSSGTTVCAVFRLVSRICPDIDKLCYSTVRIGLLIRIGGGQNCPLLSRDLDDHLLRKRVYTPNRLTISAAVFTQLTDVPSTQTHSCDQWRKPGPQFGGRKKILPSPQIQNFGGTSQNLGDGEKLSVSWNLTTKC